MFLWPYLKTAEIHIYGYNPALHVEAGYNVKKDHTVKVCLVKFGYSVVIYMLQLKVMTTLCSFILVCLNVVNFRDLSFSV